MKILITCIHYADKDNNIRARKCKIIVDEDKLEKYIRLQRLLSGKNLYFNYRQIKWDNRHEKYGVVSRDKRVKKRLERSVTKCGITPLYV